MRIVSNFKDYYDGGMIYYNPEPLYIRETKLVREYDERIFYPIPSTGYSKWYGAKRHRPYELGAVSIAGKYYPFLKTGCSFYYRKSKELYDEENKFFEPHVRIVRQGKVNVEQLIEHKSVKLHEKYGVPIIAWYAKWNGKELINGLYKTWQQVELNPCLRQYEFFKLIDPVTVYQEVEMWLSNRALPEKTIPQISNNDMIEAKGFDLKHSFRNTK